MMTSTDFLGDAWCAAYLACLLAAGYAVALGFGRQRSRMELFGLAACLGPAVVGGILIALSFLGHAPSRFSILNISVLALAVVIYQETRGRLPFPKAKRRISILWLTIALIIVGYAVNAVGSDVIIFPTLEWDAFAIWQLKAKVLAALPLLPCPDYFHDVHLSYSHLRYPILVPMISAGAMAMSGPGQEDLARAPYLLMFLGLAAIVYSHLRRRRGAGIATLAAGMLMTAPVMLEYAGTGTAEMALTAFMGCSAVCLLRWIAAPNIPDLIFIALFSAAMAWTKNEGLPMAIINAAAILLFTPSSSNPSAILAAPIAPSPESHPSNSGDVFPHASPQSHNPPQLGAPAQYGDGDAPLAPSPGNPGEGWGEGRVEGFDDQGPHPRGHAPARPLPDYRERGLGRRPPQLEVTPPRPKFLFNRFFAASALGVFILAAFAPWWFYAGPLPRTDEDYGTRLTTSLILEHLKSVPQILGFFASEFASLPNRSDHLPDPLHNWTIFWYLLAFIAIVNPRSWRQRPILMLWAMLLMQIGAYTLAFMITTWKLQDLMEVTVLRLVLHVLPLGALLIGLQWPSDPPGESPAAKASSR